jgi:hypothetical protein
LISKNERKNEMKNIGKYKGCDCYVCSNKEYNECTIRPEAIYIIDGTMVKNCLIVGHYDGNVVRDVYDCVPYKVRHEPGPQVKISVGNKNDSENVVELPQIDFKDYSKVVDEFFKNLT